MATIRCHSLWLKRISVELTHNLTLHVASLSHCLLQDGLLRNFGDFEIWILIRALPLFLYLGMLEPRTVPVMVDPPYQISGWHLRGVGLGIVRP